MSIAQWRSLFFFTTRAVCPSKKAYLHVFEASERQFPALQQLRGFTTLEVLLLAWLIFYKKGMDFWQEEFRTESNLKEVMGDITSSATEFSEALATLTKKGWLTASVHTKGVLFYRPNRTRLLIDGLLDCLLHAGI
jgi:hypothetical protein